jgi:HK97 gp10 family phage protein
MTAVIVGVPELVAKNQQMMAALTAALPKALTAAVLPIMNEAKRLAPYKTGNLKRSITVKSEGLFVAVGTDVVYARRMELGFRGADSLGRVYNQAPRPYLRPAFDALAPAVPRELATALRAEVAFL